MIKSNQSIFDTLIDLMPDIKRQQDQDYVNPIAAKTLFSIWRTGQNNHNTHVYKKPVTTSLSDIENMKKEGLINLIGDNIEITEKGSKVLKIMILGDNTSSFDDNGVIIDYNEALNRMKNVKTAKQGNKKVANQNGEH